MRRQALVRPLGPYSVAGLSAKPLQATAASGRSRARSGSSSPKSFALHEAAYNAVRGDPAGALPTTSCGAPSAASTIPTARISHPDKCAATAGKRYEQSRLGWAAQTVGETCYESNGPPRRYSPTCERKYSWGSAKEDYVLPEAHTSPSASRRKSSPA